MLSRRGQKGRAEVFGVARTHEMRSADPTDATLSFTHLTHPFTQKDLISVETIDCSATPGNLVVDDPACLDDLARNVYCVLGMPIDGADLTIALRLIETAASRAKPFLISTPNLNFLVNSQSDPEFRESLLDSNFCPADGMPIVWIAHLMGVPVKNRVSGSDIFEALKTLDQCGRTLNVFLFGGAPGVAAAAAAKINAVSSGLRCVGSLDPGFGAIEEMSREHLIDKVNASNADFLAVSLGAKKGQLWLHRNHRHLTVPIRSHLGAAINFQAGTVKRAPPLLRSLGFEWLWRIKEEPHLWRRYAHDGLVLVHLLLTRALPLAVLNRWHKVKFGRQPKDLLITVTQIHDYVTITVSGDADQRNIEKAIACFRETLTKTYSRVVIDLASTRVIDARFLGLLLMVRKHLKRQGTNLGFAGMSPVIRRLFRLNEVDFLLNSAIEQA
jgi:N-acetylglucosaminyldiphosphoundecaprenol N-acetyl-beta-D-mannosaminyltransferase